MKKVYIGELSVPKESEAEFLEAARRSGRFIRTLPGFVEGFLYEKKDGESHHNFMTTAVWESEEAFENAKAAIVLDNQRRGYDPQETAKRLKIETVRSTFERSPY
jgi:heme-degrading monooxygenase HmoA